MSKRVGIDIGATAVRAVEVSGVDADGIPQVTAVSTVRVPPGAIAGGRIQQPGQVADALRRALKAGRMSRYAPVIGLATPDVALATVSLPAAVKPAERGSVLRLEGNPISPKIPMDEALLGFSVITRPEDPAGQVLLSVSAVRRDDVAALMEVCRLAKVTPAAVDLAAAATFRGLTALPAADTTAVSTLINIGASTTTVATRIGLRLRSVRTIEIGGETVSRAVQGALTIPFERADELKKSLRVGDEAATAPKSAAARALASVYGSLEDSGDHEVEDTTVTATRAVTAACDAIVEEIASAVEEDLTKNLNNPTTALLLCGRGALMHGLATRVETRLGIHTTVKRPYLRVKANSRTRDMFIDGSPDPSRLLEIVTAAGLAIWQENL